MGKYEARVDINKQMYYQNGVLHSDTQIYAIGNSPAEFVGAVKIASEANKGNQLENKIFDIGSILSLDP